MTCSEESFDLLISTVQKYPELYDASHVDYKNAPKKSTIWEKVAHESGIGNEIAAQKKWKSLRDYYKRVLRVEAKTGQKAKKRASWPYMSQMAFLKDFLAYSMHQENISAMEQEEKPLITSSNNEDDVMLMENTHRKEHRFNECSNSDIIFSENDEAMELHASGDRSEMCNFDSRKSTKFFINVVKKYPLLYDTTVPEYRNCEKKNKIWLKVAEECKISDVRRCQKKWKSFRDYYKRLIRSGGEVNENRWTFCKDMRFMDRILSQTPQKNSTTANSSSDSEDQHENSYSNGHFEKHLKSLETTNKMIMNYLERKVKENERKTQRDNLSTFFQSMEDLVRTFSTARQLEVKCKLSALIYGIEAAEMKERLSMPKNNRVPMNPSAPGPSSNLFVNNSNNCNLPYQNPNVYPSCSSQPFPPQNYASNMLAQHLATFTNQPMQYHPRMSTLNKS